MMKLRRGRSRRRVKAEMNVVPYIDVMLVLLVIFMIAAPLINQTVQVSLPVVPGEPFSMPEDIPSGQQPLIITVDSKGLMYMNYADEDVAQTETSIVLKALELRGQYDNFPIIIRGDKNTPYDELFNMVLKLRKKGIESIGLATTVADEGDAAP